MLALIFDFAKLVDDLREKQNSRFHEVGRTCSHKFTTFLQILIYLAAEALVQQYRDLRYCILMFPI